MINPYDTTSLLKNIFGFKPYVHESDPNYDTRPREAHEARAKIEAERLAKHPTELEDVDVFDILTICENHQYDALDLGECIKAHIKTLAEKQAEKGE